MVQGIVKIGVPQECSICGGGLKYTGLGEYECEECKNIELDDYGKVRAYLEHNRGATQTDISRATGVSTNRIRQLLQDERIEVTPDSMVYLHCEICGAAIRSGRRCAKCEEQYEKDAEANRKAGRVPANLAGFGMASSDNDGEMRFLKK